MLPGGWYVSSGVRFSDASVLIAVRGRTHPKQSGHSHYPPQTTRADKVSTECQHSPAISVYLNLSQAMIFAAVPQDQILVV